MGKRTTADAIVINYNTPAMTMRAVRAALDGLPELEVRAILVDNGSIDKVPSGDRKDPRITYLDLPENLGFAGGVNAGLALSSSEYAVLVNSDAILDPGALALAIAFMEKKPDIGITGIRLEYPDGRTQASFGRFPGVAREFLRFSMLSKVFQGGTVVFRNRFTETLFTEPSHVDWVSGGLMVIRRQALLDTGRFDAAYRFGIEDWDFCLRARRAGWKTAYYPSSRAVHYHGFSSGGRRSTWSLAREAEGADRFLRKHFPERSFQRMATRMLYKLKIMMLDLVFSLAGIIKSKR